MSSSEIVSKSVSKSEETLHSFAELREIVEMFEGRILPGGFRVGEWLSSGEFGCVVLGEKVDVGTPVVVKFSMVNEEQTPHEIRILNLLSESIWAPTLHHEGLLDSKYQFLVLSKEGRTLLELQKNWLPEGLLIPVVLNIWLEAVRALEFLHKKGVIHRDLHCGNILVSASPGKGMLVLIDYGLSAIRQSTGAFICAEDTAELDAVFLTPLDVTNGDKHCEVDDLIQLLYLSLVIRFSEVTENKSNKEFNLFKAQLHDKPEEVIPAHDAFLIPIAKAIFRMRRYDEQKKSLMPNHTALKRIIRKSPGYDLSCGIY